MAALQEQIDILNESIWVEEERVRLVEESLRLEEARQAQARLALLEETRLWEEEERLASHYLDILGRIPAEIEERLKKGKEGIDKIIDTWERWDPGKVSEAIKKVGIDIDALKAKLAEAFLAPIREELKITAELTDTLRKIFDKHFGPEGIPKLIDLALAHIGYLITEWYNEQFDKAWEWGEDQWKAFSKWYEDIKAETVKWAEAMWKEYTEYYEELYEETVERLTELYEEAVKWLGEQLAAFETWAADVLADAAVFWANLLKEAGLMMGEIAVAIATGLADWLAIV